MVEVKWVREARGQTTGGQQRRLARKGEHEPPQVVAHPRAPWPGGPGGWVQEANNSYLLLCAWRNRGALAEPPKIFSFVRLVLPNLSESEATGGGQMTIKTELWRHCRGRSAAPNILQQGRFGAGPRQQYLDGEEFNAIALLGELGTCGVF